MLICTCFQWFNTFVLQRQWCICNWIILRHIFQFKEHLTLNSLFLWNNNLSVLKARSIWIEILSSKLLPSTVVLWLIHRNFLEGNIINLRWHEFIQQSLWLHNSFDKGWILASSTSSYWSLIIILCSFLTLERVYVKSWLMDFAFSTLLSPLMIEGHLRLIHSKSMVWLSKGSRWLLLRIFHFIYWVLKLILTSHFIK